MKLKQQQQTVSNVPNTYNMCYDIASANKICYAFFFITKKNKK